MEKKILSHYEVVIYDTGEIEFHPIVEKNNFAKCSSSMRQVLLIIEHVLKEIKIHPNKNIHFIVVTAINQVAKTERVNRSTVHSKILRKLGISMRDFKKLLSDCINNKAPDNDEFVGLLYSSCVARTKRFDENGVKRVVEKIRNSA